MLRQAQRPRRVTDGEKLTRDCKGGAAVPVGMEPKGGTLESP